MTHSYLSTVLSAPLEPRNLFLEENIVKPNIPLQYTENIIRGTILPDAIFVKRSILNNNFHFNIT